MPCRSDYMEPNNLEKQLQETAQLLLYTVSRCSEREVKHNVPASRLKSALIGSRDPYCQQDVVPDLCKLIRSLGDNDFNAIVYNARDPKSRQLADWWEKHEAADVERREKEEAERQRIAGRDIRYAEITAKLTADDVAFLDRYYAEMM